MTETVFPPPCVFFVPCVLLAGPTKLGLATKRGNNNNHNDTSGWAAMKTLLFRCVYCSCCFSFRKGHSKWCADFREGRMWACPLTTSQSIECNKQATAECAASLCFCRVYWMPFAVASSDGTNYRITTRSVCIDQRSIFVSHRLQRVFISFGRSL